MVAGTVQAKSRRGDKLTEAKTRKKSKVDFGLPAGGLRLLHHGIARRASAFAKDGPTTLRRFLSFGEHTRARAANGAVGSNPKGRAHTGGIARGGASGLAAWGPYLIHRPFFACFFVGCLVRARRRGFFLFLVEDLLGTPFAGKGPAAAAAHHHPIPRHTTPQAKGR